MAGMAGAGDAGRGDPAGGQERSQRLRDICGSRAARRWVAQAGDLGGIDHIKVEVDRQRATGQGGGAQARDICPPDGRTGQVGGLGQSAIAC